MLNFFKNDFSREVYVSIPKNSNINFRCKYSWIRYFLSEKFSNKMIESVKVWRENLLWKNTCGLIFDTTFNSWLTFNKNLQQKTYFKSSWGLTSFSKRELDAFSRPLEKGGVESKWGRWGWKWYSGRIADFRYIWTHGQLLLWK